MDDVTRLAVFGGAVPLVVAAGFIAPGRGPAEADRAAHAWRFPVGLALPLIAAFLVLYGWPREQWQSMTWIPAAGLVVGVIMSATPRAAWGRGLLCVVLGAASLTLLWPVFERESTWLKVGVAVGVAGLAGAVEPLAVRRRGAVVSTALLVATATAAFISLTSGSFKLPTSLVGLGVGLGVCAVAPIWKRGFTMADGPVAVAVPILVTSPVVAMLYSTDPFPLACYLLPAAAPLLAWAGEVGALRRRPVVAAIVSLALVAGACGAAVAVALGGDGEDAAADPMMQMYEEMMGQ